MDAGKAIHWLERQGEILIKHLEGNRSVGERHFEIAALIEQQQAEIERLKSALNEIVDLEFDYDYEGNRIGICDDERSRAGMIAKTALEGTRGTADQP
jgi:hypothetical protein